MASLKYYDHAKMYRLCWYEDKVAKSKYYRVEDYPEALARKKEIEKGTKKYNHYGNICRGQRGKNLPISGRVGVSFADVNHRKQKHWYVRCARTLEWEKCCKYVRFYFHHTSLEESLKLAIECRELYEKCIKEKDLTEFYDIYM